MNINSAFLRLSQSDIVKGFVVTVLSAVLTAVVQMLGNGFDWTQLWNIAVISGVAYLSKNLLSTEDGRFAGVL